MKSGSSANSPRSQMLLLNPYLLTALALLGLLWIWCAPGATLTWMLHIIMPTVRGP